MATQIFSRGHYSTHSWTVGTNSPVTADYSLQWADSKTGVSNPRWREQVRALQSATTPFSASRQDVKVHELNGWVMVHHPSIGKGTLTKVLKGFQNEPIMPSVLSTSVSSANNAALSSLYSRLRSSDVSANGLTILGELRETIHMLRHPAEGMMRFASNHLTRVEKHAKRYRGRDLQKAISGSYLEYAFGVMPFIHDVSDIAKALDEAGKPRVTVVSGHGADKKANVTTIRNQIRELVFLTNTKTETETSVRYKVGLNIAVGAPSTVSLRESLGFKLDEFVPTLYELLPWSFLVDYFTNIGDIVSAVTYCSHNLSWSCKTVRVTSSREAAWTIDPAFTKKIFAEGYFIGCNGSGKERTEKSSVVRSAEMPGYPSLEISIPGIGKKWVNMAALLAQNKSILKLLHKA